MTRALIVGGLTVATLIGAVVLGWSLVDRGARADPTNPEQVALGEQVYGQYCASCHGASLEGQPDWQSRLPSGRLPAPPHDETGHTWHHPDDVIVGIVKEGLGPYAPEGYESDMPAFGDVLTDEEIWAVLAYLKSEWPPRIQQRQTVITEQAVK